MSKSLILTTLLLAATAQLPTGTYRGAFNTNGTCTLCTVANGGITSFSVPIQTGSSVTNRAILLFDALDSSNLTDTLPQYNTTTQSLSSTSNPVIEMLEQIKSGTAPGVNGMMVNPAHNAPWCGSNSGGDHAGAPEFAAARTC